MGLARGAVEDCIVYLQEREQFGRPIGDFQYLRFTLAEMAAKVEQARAFYQRVAHKIDAGQPCVREAAMVKLLATEMAVEVTNLGSQLHGGNGYTTERRVERYWRDARLTTIFEGTSEIQRKIIADRLLPKSSLSRSDPDALGGATAQRDRVDPWPEWSVRRRLCIRTLGHQRPGTVQ